MIIVDAPCWPGSPGSHLETWRRSGYFIDSILNWFDARTYPAEVDYVRVWHVAREELADVSVEMFEPVVQADLDDDRRFYPALQELFEGYLLELGRRKHDDVEQSAPLDSLVAADAYNCFWPFLVNQLRRES